MRSTGYFKGTVTPKSQLHCVKTEQLSHAGLTVSLFFSHKDEYVEHEQASLKQLYQAKVPYSLISSFHSDFCRLDFVFMASESIRFVVFLAQHMHVYVDGRATL